MRQAAWPETMLSRRFTHYLQPRALKVAPRGLRNLLGCLRNRTTRVSIPKAAISRASYGDLAPSSTLYRRTRLMTQYEKIKENYKDYILLFQVGDFYEIYGEDASEVASKTSLRLTRKKNVFMAGFPIKALSEWQRTLVEAGFQLAICTQNTPQEGKRTILLGRDVVKLVTPGTLIEPLDNEANYLLCLSTGPGSTVGLAWIDISTGEFQVSSSEMENIDEDLERICPSEVLLHDELADSVKHGRTYQSTHPMARCSERLAKSSLLKECHITGVPASWFSEEIKKEMVGKSRKRASSRKPVEDNQHEKHK